jgi:MFS family permease
MVNSYLQALLALFITGFSMVITSTSAISLLQLQAEDEERGKVMGAFTTSFMGFFPLGSLVIGGAAQITGLRKTLFAAGLMAFIFVCVQAVKYHRQR